jgi:putative membrane protein
MNLILHLLLDAAVIFGLAYLMPQVDVKSFGTALVIAVILAMLNFLVGWLIRFPLNLVTLFFLTGIVRIVVTAILLKLIDKMMGSFTIVGFWPALVIAVTVAIVGAVVDGALAPSPAVVEERRQEAILLAPVGGFIFRV